MKILIIDRDDVTTQLMKSKLEPLGHQITTEHVKNDAIERLSSETFDIIFVDPSPLTSARPLVLNIRRSVGNYPYIILLSENSDQEEALKIGTNDALQKPLDIAALDEKINNAKNIINLIKRIGDDSEDFPSAGGVIAKSAFNQLFLSGIDRADRYGERTFVLFITMSNYTEIRDMDGQYAADYAVAKLSQYLVLMRRQSDIIGQTGRDEYALLLQRPIYETEPMEAAKRFAESLEGCKDIVSEGSAAVEITVSLIDLPVGSMVSKYIVTPGEEQER